MTLLIEIKLYQARRVFNSKNYDAFCSDAN